MVHIFYITIQMVLDTNRMQKFKFNPCKPTILIAMVLFALLLIGLVVGIVFLVQENGGGNDGT